MPVVDITIGNRDFQLVCGEGQESHLQGLAADVSARLEELAKTMNTGNDVLLLVMTTLMIQDELNELYAAKTGEAPPPRASLVADTQEQEDLAVAEAMHSITDYVNKLADKYAA